MIFYEVLSWKDGVLDVDGLIVASLILLVLALGVSLIDRK